LSNVTIQLLKKVDVTNPQVGKKYQQMVVTHTDVATNKTDGKKLFDFTTPKDVWNTLLNAQPLQFFEVTRQKNDKGYWEWHGIKEVDGAAAAPAVSSSTPASVAVPSTGSSSARVGNWETPEERNAKQHYIVRQSSISSAIEFYRHFAENQPEVGVGDILEVAKRFEDYVFGQKGVAGLTNDIPE